MKNRVVMSLVLMLILSFSSIQIVKADSFSDTVRIYFESITEEPIPPNNTEEKDHDFIKDETNKTKESKLPQLGQLLTSVIVLLLGIIIVLIIVMLYLIKKVKEYKRIGG